MIIEKWSIDRLKGWDKNPRNISPEGYDRLKKQIFDLNLYKPLLVNEEGIVLGGNMRLRALKESDTKEVMVSIVEAKTEDMMLKYSLSDNDQMGYTDKDLLLSLIESHPEIELDTYAIHLAEPETLDKFMDQFSEVVEDEVPDVPTEAISKLGEVYQLGKHKLMCGDATKIEDVEKLMHGQKADLIVTDPPYNTGMEEKKDSAGSTRLSHMFSDNLTPEQFKILIEQSFANMLMVTKGECVFYVFIDWRNVGFIKDKLQELMPVKNIIVWDKVVHGLGSDYKFTYEMCVVGKKGEPKIENRIGNDYQDIWRVQRTMGRNEDHATAKPLELLKKPILHASKQDDIVLDLFGGSGSTLIACEQTNRICMMCEIDNKYVDVIIKRWMKFTGKRAYKTIDADGNPCNTLVKFADESFMESKTLQEDSEAQKEELQNTVQKNVGQ